MLEDKHGLAVDITPHERLHPEATPPPTMPPGAGATRTWKTLPVSPLFTLTVYPAGGAKLGEDRSLPEVLAKMAENGKSKGFLYTFCESLAVPEHKPVAARGATAGGGAAMKRKRR